MAKGELRKKLEVVRSEFYLKIKENFARAQEHRAGCHIREDCVELQERKYQERFLVVNCAQTHTHN